MPAVARQLIGRTAELATIRRLLESAAEPPRALVLAGQAGIGKTALWLAGIDQAAASGHRVLSSRPSEAEARLSYTGLADLLGDVVDDVLPELPAPQRRALEVALLLADGDARADERAVAAAFLSSLRLVVADGPLCLAVDDVQWLDAASTTSLSFALSRLDDRGLVVLLTARGEPPSWLARCMPDRLTTVQVDGLSIGALRELLHHRLEASFSRPTLLRLWETSAGNPFYALELARALQRRGEPPSLGDPLPLPSTLDELLKDRLDALDTAAQDVVQVVAAVAEPTVPLVERVLPGVVDTGLPEALDAGILEVDGDRLRFTHPLLGTAVAVRQAPAVARSLHARLATLVDTLEERARHLALSTAEPDHEIAATLEEAARSALERGASSAAAELAEQALRLTPPAETADATRRRFLAADRYHAAGDGDRATALLAEARAAAAPGRERAAVLTQLARVTLGARDAAALYREALPDAEGDEALEAEIHLGLAGLLRLTEGFDRGLEHGRRAVLAASRVGDAALRCRALAKYSLLHFFAGQGIPSAEMEEALDLERSLGELPLADGPAAVHGRLLWWSAEVDRGRPLLQEVHAAAQARNDAPGQAGTMWQLSLLEWRAGNWEAADRWAAQSVELDTQLGSVWPHDRFPAAVIAAHRGRLDRARATAEEAIRGEPEGSDLVGSTFGWVLGFIELSLGDPTAALPHLRRAYELRSRWGSVAEPAMRLEVGDLLETLVAASELEEAEAVLAREGPRAAALDRGWALAIHARGRALLAAARGDLEGAFAGFELALVEHERAGDPFQQARTLLALGRTQRRAKKRAAARATLEDALARFEALDAPLWAEQARSELGRIGGRSPARDGELTEAERRIAALVAEGRTNRQVAAALFLTEHSVETALTRVYRKLGIHSRTELARRLTGPG